jgi:carbamoyl-phosphate synthase small subunit
VVHEVINLGSSESASQSAQTGLHHLPTAILALEDGRIFTGKGFGATTTAVGELVFNTSLFGYQEILTDPSYAGQVVTLTYPEIGNYGTNDDDLESRQIFARGLVIRHLSRVYSSWRATDNLDHFLKRFNIVGITEIDTRAVTKHIREKGALRCAISSDGKSAEELVELARKSASMEGADFTDEVSTPVPYTKGKGNFNVAVLDYGIKTNIVNQLVSQNMTANVYPARTPAAEILAKKPDGIFLSNGPGDPAASTELIAEVKKLIDSGIPIFGICLGHQFLSIALGAKTYKLKFGHRGGNQPVKDLTTGKVEVTCQNHGFAVDGQSLPDTISLTHVNLNDHSVEGFAHKVLPIFAVQYHPEASPGPHDSNYLFKRFYDLIENSKAKVR